MGKYHQLFPSGWTSLLSSRLNTEVILLACLTCALLLVSVSNAKKKIHRYFFFFDVPTHILTFGSQCLSLDWISVCFFFAFPRVDLSCAHLKNLTAHPSICKMRLAETEGSVPKGSVCHTSWTRAVKNAKAKFQS